MLSDAIGEFLKPVGHVVADWDEEEAGLCTELPGRSGHAREEAVSDSWGVVGKRRVRNESGVYTTLTRHRTGSAWVVLQQCPPIIGRSEWIL